MLTIQSNLKIQDLETLSKILIKPDIINFGLNKVGGGYTDKIADKVIAKLSKLDKDKTIVIINDITLQMADKLLEAGYKNIYLAFGSFNKDGTVSKDKTVYNIMKAVIENNIKEKLNAISLEEIFNMKIDGIIANPPYGKIGANITNVIRDRINYEDFINLLPMVDYEKADNKYELWQHLDLTTVDSCPGGFEDAGISPLIVKVKKYKINNLSSEDFRISCLENKLTQKYFKENNIRKDTFTIAEQFITLDLSKSIALPLRTKSGNHAGQANLGKSEKSQFYNINNGLKQSVTKEETKSICCTTINFKSEIEKQNVAKLFYSNIGYKFTSWLMTGMNRDAFHLREHHMWFPKVDWTRSWTVEEILKDYGYTEDEIKTVMADLDNFRGMDD